jgi:ubiquinone/menaquinone biosynthesis C-methylase UbiE
MKYLNMYYLDILKYIWDYKAEKYDIEDKKGFISQFIFNRSIFYLRKYFRPNSKLLELGCGTGTEAIELAKYNNYKILAIDISSKMIEIAKNKALKENLNQNVEFKVLPIEEIKVLKNMKFNGVYSLGGALNCVEDIKTAADVISKIIVPNGYFIASLINKYCLFETLFFLFKLNFKKAFRRFLTNPVKIKLNINLPEIKVFYYTPKKFYSFFKNNFILEKIVALPFAIPPQYLENVYSKFKIIFNKILNLEEKMSEFYPFNTFGDHFIIIMRRKTNL